MGFIAPVFLARSNELLELSVFHVVLNDFMIHVEAFVQIQNARLQLSCLHQDHSILDIILGLDSMLVCVREGKGIGIKWDDVRQGSGEESKPCDVAQHVLEQLHGKHSHHW